MTWEWQPRSPHEGTRIQEYLGMAKAESCCSTWRSAHANPMLPPHHQGALILSQPLSLTTAL